jgi:S-methylmethionine-dependent homocysteine/selenocysteine methylase
MTANGKTSSGGVDFLQASTLPALSEAIGVSLARSDTGLPYVISFVIDKSSRLLDGTLLSDAICLIDERVGGGSVRFAVNCIHPAVLHQAL